MCTLLHFISHRFLCLVSCQRMSEMHWIYFKWNKIKLLFTFSFIFSIFFTELRLWCLSSSRIWKTGSPDRPICFSSCFSASFSLLSALMLSAWYMWYVFMTCKRQESKNNWRKWKYKGIYRKITGSLSKILTSKHGSYGDWGLLAAFFLSDLFNSIPNRDFFFHFSDRKEQKPFLLNFSILIFN